MGQKVNPIGIRLGIIKDWNSKWYAKPQDYAKTLIKDLDIRQYLQRQLKNASVSKIAIERTAQNVLITVHSARPGVIIGKKGDDIDKLRKEVTKRLGVPVHISIEEIRRPELDAKLTAESIAQQLERRIMFRRAMKRAVQGALRAGAQGVKVKVSGRLGGAEIARSEWYREGRVPLHTLRADIDYGVAEALTTYGIIGVKVWIFKGEVLANQSVEEKTVLVDSATEVPKKPRVKKAVKKVKTTESEDRATATKKAAVVKKKTAIVNKESAAVKEQGDTKATTSAKKTIAKQKVDKTADDNVDADNAAESAE